MNKIDDVLLAFRDKCSSCMWNKEITTNANCQECLGGAKKDVLEIILAKKPKKKEYPPLPFNHIPDGNIIHRDGFNQGVDEYEKKIMELFK